MDFFAHALYGATLCSRSGMAGSRQGGGGWQRDPTVWIAALMGIGPDIVSMGGAFTLFVLRGMPGHFFRDFGGVALTIYRCAHSLLFAALLCGLVRRIAPRYFTASLAWPLHILLDAPTHGAGRFQTTLFYPLSGWGLDAIRWWERPEVILGYWLLLPIIWALLSRWRAQRHLVGAATPSNPMTSNKSDMSGRPVRCSRSAD